MFKTTSLKNKYNLYCNLLYIPMNLVINKSISIKMTIILDNDLYNLTIFLEEYIN